MPHTKNHLLAVFFLAHWLLTVGAFGQTQPPKPMTDTAFVELIQARLKQVDDAQLDEAGKTKVRDLYQQALREMESAKTWAAKTAHFEKQAASAPVELEQTKAELATLPANPASLTTQNIALPQIEQAISKRESELAQWRSALTDLEAEPKRRAARRMDIPRQATAAKEKLADANAELQAPAAGDDTSPAITARRIMLLARRRNVEQEVLSYNKELAAYEVMADLLPLRRDLAARRVGLAEQEVKQWQEFVNRRRQQEAEQQMQQASWEAGQAHPALRRLAEEKAALAEMRKALAQRIVETTRLSDQTSQQLATLKEQFKRARDKVETVGLTNAIGLLLRKQRESLPNLRAHRNHIAARQQTIREGQLALLQLEDQRSQLANLDLQTRAVLQNLNWAQDQVHRADLEAAVREALQAQREYLDSLIADHNTYFDKLVDLDNAERQLIEQTERCARYIDERVLWIGSATPLGAADIRPAGDALWWLAGPDACLDLGRTLAADASRNPVVPALAMCLFLALFYWRLRFRARVREIGEKAARGNCYRFLPTLEVLALTLMIAAVWPGVLWYVGWRLSAAADASELCKAVGAGLTVAARVYLVLELLRQTCCCQGLAEAHFGWPASALKPLRQKLRWLSLPLLPLVFVTVAMSAQENDRWDGSLGRIGFVAALLCCGFFLQRILRPNGAVAQAVVAERQGGWLDRFRYVWYPLGVLTPPALAALAAVGYYYTAEQLAERLVITMYLLVGLILMRSVLLRWTLVSQRKLAIEQARQRRAATQNEAAVSEEAPIGAGHAAAAKPERDLATINTQTRRLVEYSLALAGLLGVWFAWVDVLPALRILNQVEVWNTGSTLESLAGADNLAKPETTPRISTAAAAESSAAADGSSKTQLRTHPGAITLADLGLAVLLLATTIIAAKNIPGLLEMAVLQHLPFDAGARYAVATVSRYVITIVGVMFTCGAVGFGWAKVQWLVAAMSLGLGFGLQEIFANFISGLIILFERPIRVGDVVTIDTITGVVSRIRMRATTITDWDRKELIIPNKEFITGRVLNWTLSDPVNRVVVNVGIAYGSDTERAAEILMKVAQDHPNVLDDPPPRVTLESFGDSALNFVLKCFLPNLENRGTVIHELHMAIDRAFREAGIEIAFPQQDVHVRSIDSRLPLAQALAMGANTPWSPEKIAARQVA